MILNTCFWLSRPHLRTPRANAKPIRGAHNRGCRIEIKWEERDVRDGTSSARLVIFLCGPRETWRYKPSLEFVILLLGPAGSSLQAATHKHSALGSAIHNCGVRASASFVMIFPATAPLTRTFPDLN